MGVARYTCAFHTVAPDGNDDVFDVTFLNNRIKCAMDIAESLLEK